MVTPKFLKADKQSALYLDFHNIFQSIAHLQERFLHEYEFSPFDFTEMTAVSTFVWAAGSCNRLALAEYQVKKSEVGGEDCESNGRADFWIAFTEHCYSLEFKVAKYQATAENLRERFCAARRDAGRVDINEYDQAFGVLVAYVDEKSRSATYKNFAEQDDVQLAVRIGKKEQGSCYIYFGGPKEDLVRK